MIFTDTLGIRGIDNRSKFLPITFLFAMSLTSKKISWRKFNRVGRFEDSFSLVRLNDLHAP